MSRTARRVRLQTQLQLANDELTHHQEALDTRGVAADARKKDPKWRHLNARCRDLRKRMARIDEITALDEEVKQRKNQEEPASAE